MVHRRTSGHEAGGEQAVEGRKTKRSRDAIMVIKKQMLRCNKGGEQGRFKRGYLAGGWERGDAADTAIFYLACIVCGAPSSFSASR
uniref:Uncharacterized protein n=1 Tax=Arundo donax TaxID=35708 RepID=A0A0A9CAD9_ARUDO